MKSKTLIFLAMTSMAASAGSALAQDTTPAGPKPAPGPLSADEIKAVTVSILPSPAEILEAAGGSSKIDWRAVGAQIATQPDAFKSDYPLDEHKALNLGVQVANTLVALYAEDQDLFGKAAAAVEKLAYELSADEEVADARAGIQTLVDQQKWDDAKRAVEELRGKVIERLQQHGDKTSVALAHIGGWLRGVELVSGHIASNYSAESAKLLRQSDLVASLASQIAGVEGGNETTEKLLDTVREGLKSLEETTRTSTTESVSEENSKKIAETASDVVSAIRS